ncbi:magnesium transporter CorA family protein [Paenibacillus polymyxa]|uniref:magnesium transporter CorA family protein n=1 Tax=Paenibacillus polymyxa TaxID=1406 RepID=UPI000589C123|nr:magnesium transporter CorA family protein [Paenibacillus polymyxa]AJE52457.1 magnesium transporter [Paenibacillus polymyxa]QOH63719.1 magnesium transporter [Paenibacillus polymyxa]
MTAFEQISTFRGGWEWWDICAADWQDSVIQHLKEKLPEAAEWLDKVEDIPSSFISVRFPDGTQPLMCGSLIYSVQEEIDSQRNCNKFYFLVLDQKLVTLNLDQNTREIMHTAERQTMLEQCEDAADGMFVLARAVLHYFHTGMDKFEINLRRLEEDMEKRNARTLMDSILNARFELLYWSNMFIPFSELVTASREAYLDKLEENRFFKQLLYRVTRMEGLFRHYEKEIDTLISIDDAISAFRGNEITKTLTIVTAVFTPATVVGAIWGMNFENLPWIKTGWGFTFVIVVTLLSMAGMYGWLMMKGWTGDLLKTNKRNKL